jgi:hypothetical protein
MRDALKKLLDRLDLIGSEHEELFDSDVRESMGDAIMEGFVRHRADYEVPDDFGMFSRKGNEAVRSAIPEFVTTANQRAQLLHQDTFHVRLSAVQDRSVRSDDGTDYDDFLGHSPPEFYDEAGNVTRTQ